MKISSIFKPLSFLPALAVMYMIYSFSGQTGEVSSSVSYEVSSKIVKGVDLVFKMDWDEWQEKNYALRLEGIVRKLAHMIEYFLLAVSVSFPLYVYGIRGVWLMLLAGAICVLYACGDEYHQSFVSGRSASKRDVGIDSIGILGGIILVRLIGWSGRMAITGPAYERRQNRRQRELDEREAELERRELALRRGEIREARKRNSPARDSFDTGRRDRLENPYHTYSPEETANDISMDSGRTRVYRTSEERKLDQEQFRARQIAQEELLNDYNTSDDLSDDMPLSHIFRHHK